MKEVTEKKIKNYELFVEYNINHNIYLRNEIFEKYKYIAEILSRKYSNKGIEYDDIYQVACIGLLYAIERFNFEKGFEFISFATPTIMGEIKKYFRDKGRTIRVPRRIQEMSRKIIDAKATLVQKLQKTPRIKDIASYLGYSEEEILETLEATNLFSPKSLDLCLESADEEKDLKLIDLIGIYDIQFTNLENKDFINSTMPKLNKLEKKIIIERYYNNKTQNIIANELGVSQMTISRVEKKALQKFKYEMQKEY